MIARQEVICRKACAVPLATCFAASASNAATKGLTAALLSFSQIPGLLVWVSATYRRPNSFCIASLSSKSLLLVLAASWVLLGWGVTVCAIRFGEWLRG